MKITQDKYEKTMAKHGFHIGGTGGNCTAFWKDIKQGEKKVEVLIANECETPKVGEWAVAQFTFDGGYSFSFILKDHHAVIQFAETLETN